MARFTCCRSAAIVSDRNEAARHGRNRQAKGSPHRPKPADRPDQNQIAASDRRALRAEDLGAEEIAAVEASEMEPGFEHLDAELDPAGRLWSMLRVDFARNLRARGDAAKGRPADKAFRDSLFDDS